MIMNQEHPDHSTIKIEQEEINQKVSERRKTQNVLRQGQAIQTK